MLLSWLLSCSSDWFETVSVIGLRLSLESHESFEGLAERQRLLEIDSSRQNDARQITHVPWKWSFTANALWKLTDTCLQREKQELTTTILQDHVMRKNLVFAESGPDQQIPNFKTAVCVAAAAWLRSSIQMHHMLSGAGITYLHALQLNLHHTGSKPLSDEERMLIRNADETRSRAINDG